MHQLASNSSALTMQVGSQLYSKQNTLPMKVKDNELASDSVKTVLDNKLNDSN